jgi:hypothetical protein
MSSSRHLIPEIKPFLEPPLAKLLELAAANENENQEL